MRLAIRLFLALLIVYFGIKSFRLESGGYSVGIFTGLYDMPYAILLLVTLAMILIDGSSYRAYRSFLQYGFTAMGLFFVILTGIKKWQHYRIGQADQVLQAANFPGAEHVMKFEFKRTGKFRLTEYKPGGKIVYFGSYRRTGDTFRITGSNFRDSAGRLPRSGVLHGDTLLWDGFEPMKAGQ